MTEHASPLPVPGAGPPHRQAIHPLVVGAEPGLIDAIGACRSALSMTMSSEPDLEAAARELAFGRAEIVLVDAGLGMQDTLDFVRRLRVDRCVEWVPVLVAGEAARLRPLLHVAVPAMVDHVIAMPLVLARDQEAEDLRHCAWHDALTGLANHAQAQHRSRLACAQAADGGHAFALVYLDLDGFKPINDVHGRAIGDEVLKAVARRLHHGVSRQDLVARMGGDEFLVLLRGAARAEAAEGVARRLVAALGQPMVIGSRALSVGASAGIAVHGLDGSTPEALLQPADDAMCACRRRRGYRSRSLAWP